MKLFKLIGITFGSYVGCCSAQLPPVVSSNPSAFLQVSKYGGGHVVATVLITNPTYEMICSLVTWNWGDETQSTWQQHCDESLDLPTRQMIPHEHHYKDVGNYTLQVNLIYKNKLVMRGSAEVPIP